MHHIGLRFASETDYHRANAAMGYTGVVCDTDDARRTFYKNHAGVGLEAYRGHIFYPSGPYDVIRYWHLVTQRPMGTLQFLESGFSAESTAYAMHTRPQGDKAELLIQAKGDDSILGVTVGSQWWKPEYVQE
jgi:hypothetical protein